MAPPHGPITVLDLFAGCGGLTEGFHQFRPSGDVHRPVFRSVGAVEWDRAAAASYAANFGTATPRTRYFEAPKIFCRDIIGWEPEWAPGEVDVVVGGPPCQGFSGLNRNKVRAERNQLWQEFIRVVVAVQPRVFVIENVDRFVRSPEFADLKDRMGNGDLANYVLVVPPGSKAEDPEDRRAPHYLLNAADYGALQARRRAIVIGVRTDAGLRTNYMQYPEPTHSKDPLTHQVALEGLALPVGQSAWRTVDELFDQTDDVLLRGTDLPGRALSAQGDVGGAVAGPYSTPELHITRSPEVVSLARYDAIPPGGNRKDLRGRYLCSFADGRKCILHKEGPHRDEHGRLVVMGSYQEVVDGVRRRRGFEVVAVHGESAPPEPGGRKRSLTAAVTVTEGDTRCEAQLDYLSTDSWDDHDAGSGDVMGRLRRGSPSVTVRTEFFKPEKGRYLHPTQGRPITHYEAAKLQGFPDEFLWCGSKTEIAKQIGNGVPVPLGVKIAESIYAYLRE